MRLLWAVFTVTEGGGVSVDVHVVYFWLHSVQRNTYLVLFSWYRSNKGPLLHNVHLYNPTISQPFFFFFFSRELKNKCCCGGRM